MILSALMNLEKLSQLLLQGYGEKLFSGWRGPWLSLVCGCVLQEVVLSPGSRMFAPNDSQSLISTMPSKLQGFSFL